METKVNCKINIGLHVLNRRNDGFHNIETLMYPVGGLCDILNISHSEETKFVNTGIEVDCSIEDNICLKAHRLMQSRYGISDVRIELRKVIPFGAGLGGGSANGSFTIKTLDKLFDLNLKREQMISLAAELGSDTAFFVDNTPAMCTSRGEVITPMNISLKGKTLLLLKPDIKIPTGQAYKGIVPNGDRTPLAELLKTDISSWRETIVNDFEIPAFKAHPLLAELKENLYDMGALYASMSGSGSSLYGIFDEIRGEINVSKDVFVYQEVMK